MDDYYGSYAQGLDSPAIGGAAITPDNDTDLATYTRALNVATSGTVRVTTTAGNTIDLYIAAGIAFPIRVRRVHASGTDATGIVGLW